MKQILILMALLASTLTYGQKLPYKPKADLWKMLYGLEVEDTLYVPVIKFDDGTVQNTAGGSGSGDVTQAQIDSMNTALRGVFTGELSSTEATLNAAITAAEQRAKDYADANDQVNDADADPTNEIQNLSSSASGTNRTISIDKGGTNATFSVADNDNDPTNELQGLQQVIDEDNVISSQTTIDAASNLTIRGTTAGTLEFESNFGNTNVRSLSGAVNIYAPGQGIYLHSTAQLFGSGKLKLLDGFEIDSLADLTRQISGFSGKPSDLAQEGATTGQVLKWNGSLWAPAADATSGGGGLDASTLNGQSGSYYLNYGNLTNVPSTFTPAAHTHTESDITDLDHFSGADITGSESAFSGWDKNAGDDFSGAYNDLTGKPTLFDGQYSSLTGKPTIPTNNNQLTNGAGYITNPNDADADPANELQTLSVSGNDLTISGGNTVSLPATGAQIDDNSSSTSTTYSSSKINSLIGSAGGGDMLASMYDPTGVQGDAFEWGNMKGTMNEILPKRTYDITNAADDSLYYINPIGISLGVVTSGYTNYPTNAGQMLSIGYYKPKNGSDRINNFFFDSFNNDFYFNRVNNGVVSPWYKVWHSGNLTSTSVANWNAAYGWGDWRQYGLNQAKASTGTDFNTLSGYTGFHLVLGPSANAPTTDDYFVQTIANSSTSGATRQIAYRRSSAHLYTRGGTAGGWYKLWTEADFDYTDFATVATLNAHANRTDNPHAVTAAQLGLGNVNNTSDADKPISTATQAALDGKANTTHTHVISDVTNLQANLDNLGRDIDRLMFGRKAISADITIRPADIWKKISSFSGNHQVRFDNDSNFGIGDKILIQCGNGATLNVIATGNVQLNFAPAGTGSFTLSSSAGGVATRVVECIAANEYIISDE